MCDGILVALKMLVTAKAKQPECKPLLIVLTDGETDMVSVLTKSSQCSLVKIPIYTIGYNAKLDILRQISTPSTGHSQPER